MNQHKNYALPIFMMILLFGMISFVTNLAAPMGVVVKSQFQASNFLGMLGNFANFLAYAFMGIPAGKLLEKVGYKKTALLAILVGFVGVGIQYLSGVAESFCISVGSLCCWFLNVYVKCCCKPNVEHAWWRR